jgi:hypothetical protein
VTPLGWLCAFLIAFFALAPPVEARTTPAPAATATP